MQFPTFRKVVATEAAKQGGHGLLNNTDIMYILLYFGIDPGLALPPGDGIVRMREAINELPDADVRAMYDDLGMRFSEGAFEVGVSAAFRHLADVIDTAGRIAPTPRPKR